MTTIVRVKRHIKEDPVEALVLSCKRIKTNAEEESNDSNSDLFEKILNFSGTVEEKDDKIAANTVKSFTKESKFSDLSSKQHVPDVRQKQRTEQKTRSDDSRFKLLSCLRSNNGFENSEADQTEDSVRKVTIVDVSKEKDGRSPEPGTSESSYVYDLYSTQFKNESDFNDLYMENLLSVQPLETQLEYRNGEDCFEDIDPDEDDSNDENNWRNDYPDTDSDMDDDDDGDRLAKQLRGFHLANDGDDFEQSNDSEDEKYMNYTDDEKYFYYEAEDLAGKRYAKYKANAMKTLIGDGDKDEESDSEDDSSYFEDASYNLDSD